MKKAWFLLLFSLTGCGDPKGWYATFQCTERDIPTGRCVAATYTCDQPSYQVTYYPYYGPRCHEKVSTP